MAPDSEDKTRAQPATEGAADNPSPSKTRMTLAQAIELANALHRRGRVTEAVGIFEQILNVSPDNADAFHYLGLCRFEQGEADQGIALVRRAIAMAPEFADAHNNLGNMLRMRGMLDEAAAAYERAIVLRPDNADAINNLGTTLKAHGRLDEAVAMFERALAIAPDHVPTLNNLGNVLVQMGRQSLALDHFHKALMLAPYDGRAYYQLGYALCLENRLEDAAEIYRRWMAIEPDKPEPRHLLAACTGENVPQRASKEFVERLFDRFAPSFDAVLDTLEYKAPALVAEAVRETLSPSESTLDVLDAGCGTGLAGPLLRPYARRLVGLDLSKHMLGLAKGRACYDELVQSDLTEHLDLHEGAYDLIAAVDTLCYFGDLHEVVRACAGALRPGGNLVFTVELSEPGTAPSGYHLHPHGRYSHTEAYLRSALVGAGLGARLVRAAELRIERTPVQGMVVVAGRP
jgi:predicted TPR repeat methyltransferase